MTHSEAGTRADYTTREVEPGVWQITDALGDRAYLVVGRRAAVLVDACAGFGDLRPVVRRLCALPVTVLLTHSHYDHVGGTYWFGDVLISAADDGRWEREERLVRDARSRLVERGALRADAPFALEEGARPHVAHVEEGDTFDVGGITVEAVALPGHTPGSMGYLLRECRVLLSGDAVTPIMCLFLDESLSIGAYRDTLRKMAGLPFDRFYTGHHDVAFGRDELGGFDACAVFAEKDRGVMWQHSVIPEFAGTIHLAPCDTLDVDSPAFRALITR